MFTTAQMLEWLFAFLMATAFFAGFGAIGSVIISHMVPKQFHDSFIRSGVRYLLLGVTAAMLWKMPEQKRVPIAALWGSAKDRDFKRVFHRLERGHGAVLSSQ